MQLQYIIVFFSLFSGVFTRNVQTQGKELKFPIDASRVFLALEKVVSFYEQNGDILNLDAYFGLRIAQGNFFELIQQEKSKETLFRSGLYKKVIRLENLISQISSNASAILRQTSPQYYNLVGASVTQPWQVVRRRNRINPKLVTTFDKRKLSDNILQKYEPCLAKLLGSPGYGDKPCDVPEECWEVMMRPGEIGYVLTHQALYFMFGEQRGCREIFTNMMKKYRKSLRSLYDRICSNIYNQLLFIEQIHPVKRIDADLMMEQCAVCGLLGYYEFLTPQRLKAVLQWQRRSGCYGDVQNERRMGQEDSRHTMRKLLMKKELPDGCESHITGVGTALLSIYLRFLLENDAHFTT